MADPDNRDGAVAVLIAAPARQPRMVRVNTTLPADVLARIDRHAEARGVTRSSFLTTAARGALAEAG